MSSASSRTNGCWKSSEPWASAAPGASVRIPRKSPLRTEMITHPDSDMMSPPGPVPLAMGLLALSRLSSIVP